MAVVLMTAWSVFSGAVFGHPFAGDFELTEVGIAIAAFSFLPYCQTSGSNVTADVFTSGAGQKTVAFLTLLASIVALGFGIILFWRMWAGLIDYQTYRETTAILQLPLWYAFVPILMSLALLVVACLITLIEAFADLRNIEIGGPN